MFTQSSSLFERLIAFRRTQFDFFHSMIHDWRHNVILFIETAPLYRSENFRRLRYASNFHLISHWQCNTVDDEIARHISRKFDAIERKSFVQLMRTFDWSYQQLRCLHKRSGWNVYNCLWERFPWCCECLATWNVKGWSSAIIEKIMKRFSNFSIVIS